MKNLIKDVMISFLKSTPVKIVLFILLIVLTIFIPKTTEICSMGIGGVICGQISANGIGYPIFFGDKFSGDVGSPGFYPLNFLINIVVFYIIACILSITLKFTVFTLNKLQNYKG